MNRGNKKGNIGRDEIFNVITINHIKYTKCIQIEDNDHETLQTSIIAKEIEYKD